MGRRLACIRAACRIGEEGLELDVSSPHDLHVMRASIGRVNGSTNPQPYLEENPPGHFRLYVGDAAERARTARGIQ